MERQTGPAGGRLDQDEEPSRGLSHPDHLLQVPAAHAVHFVAAAGAAAEHSLTLGFSPA